MDKNVIKKIINGLTFEPSNKFPFNECEYQTEITTYENITIIKWTLILFDSINPIKIWYVVDLELPMGKLDCLDNEIFTDPNYGVPKVNTLEEAIEIIDKFNSGLL